MSSQGESLKRTSSMSQKKHKKKRDYPGRFFVFADEESKGEVLKIKKLLKEYGADISEITSSYKPWIHTYMAELCKKETYPQVFFNSTHIGDMKELLDIKNNDDLKQIVEDAKKETNNGPLLKIYKSQGDNFQFHPSTIYFPPPYQRSIKNIVKVTNLTSFYAAFKLRTTAPESYLVKPRRGIIGPTETETVEIALLRTVDKVSEDDRFRFEALLLNKCPDGLKTGDIVDELFSKAKQNLVKDNLNVSYSQPPSDFKVKQFQDGITIEQIKVIREEEEAVELDFAETKGPIPVMKHEGHQQPAVDENVQKKTNTNHDGDDDGTIPLDKKEKEDKSPLPSKPKEQKTETQVENSLKETTQESERELKFDKVKNIKETKDQLPEKIPIISKTENMPSESVKTQTTAKQLEVTEKRPEKEEKKKESIKIQKTQDGKDIEKPVRENVIESKKKNDDKKETDHTNKKLEIEQKEIPLLSSTIKSEEKDQKPPLSKEETTEPSQRLVDEEQKTTISDLSEKDESNKLMKQQHKEMSEELERLKKSLKDREEELDQTREEVGRLTRERDTLQRERDLKATLIQDKDMKIKQLEAEQSLRQRKESKREKTDADMTSSQQNKPTTPSMQLQQPEGFPLVVVIVIAISFFLIGKVF